MNASFAMNAMMPAILSAADTLVVVITLLVAIFVPTVIKVNLFGVVLISPTPNTVSSTNNIPKMNILKG
jgi:hypothetical protein